MLALVFAAVTPTVSLAQDAPAAPPQAQGTRPPAISVVEAAIRRVAESVAVTGTLVAREEVQVTVDVDGMKIEEIFVDEGDTVEAGQVLARLSTDRLEIELVQNDGELARANSAIAQRENQIAEAQSSLVEAEAGLERTETLVSRGVVSQDVLDQRKSAESGARARLAIAEHGLAVALAERTLVEAQRREIELRRSKTEIKAPTDGLVLERSARIGAVASAQSGVLFRIARDGLIELDAEVMETDLVRVEPGQTVTISPAGGGTVWGTVRLLSPEINASTRLGHVRIAFSKDAPLRIGSFTRGLIEVARREGVTVPVASVVTSGDTAVVQVVKDATIETRRVKTGLSSGDVIEIVEGLSVGESVVARAGTFLRDGDEITPVAEAGEETKG